jgi:hypothetical protein
MIKAKKGLMLLLPGKVQRKINDNKKRKAFAFPCCFYAGKNSMLIV